MDLIQRLKEVGKLSRMTNEFRPKAVVTAPERKPPVEREECCKEPKKSIGLVNLVTAVSSGRVPKEVAQSRFNVCQECLEKDQTGARLFRNIQGEFYCGLPREAKIFRDEKLDGCGCKLQGKVMYRKAACPLEKWGYHVTEGTD